MNTPPAPGQPSIDPTTRVAASAVIAGDVRIGPGCSIGHGAVIVAEGAPVKIGAQCVIMDTAVIRGVTGHPVTIGDHVLVGPHTHLVGCTIADECFVATGASVFNGAVLGRGTEVRINAVVHLRTVLPPDSTVPIGWVAVGDPPHILPASAHDEIWAVQKTLAFPRYVFNLDRLPPGETAMSRMIGRYADALRRMYAADAAGERDAGTPR